jgi:hypothetical protein
VALYPASEGHKEIRLVRQGGKWQAQYGAVRATPLPGSVEAMLGALANIPTQRLVSGKKDKWNEYKVGDTSGTRVIVYKGRDPICDYWIGEGASSSGSYYGGGTSYIRPNGQDKVYAVEGFMHSLVDKSFADWRDKTFLRLNRDGITAIGFQGTPGFALSKKDSAWYIGAGKVSTDSVNKYLNGLQSRNLDHFDDAFQAPGTPDRSLSISGTSQPLVTVKAWRQPDGKWMLNSSQNPDSYFIITDSMMEKDLWRDPGAFTR